MAIDDNKRLGNMAIVYDVGFVLYDSWGQEKVGKSLDKNGGVVTDKITVRAEHSIPRKYARGAVVQPR